MKLKHSDFKKQYGQGIDREPLHLKRKQKKQCRTQYVLCILFFVLAFSWACIQGKTFYHQEERQQVENTEDSTAQPTGQEGTEDGKEKQGENTAGETESGTLRIEEEENNEAEPLPTLQLHAASAVLLDGESGRVLYEKDGEKVLPMASTTKIMTCILALENGNLEDLVTVSAYAASMPDVQLNIKEGEQYLLRDLLYSLMLASHNDTAVAVAEHIGGTVETFADMMNDKAEEIGCQHTFFVTPNGLDGSRTVVMKDGKEIVRNHETTARDLARIMRYCVLQSPQKELFCQITQTPAHTFSNKIPEQGGDGNRTFSCVNHNAFLQMWDGAISGKTGFTGKAGYCYVGACETKNGVMIGALLASGWPPAKTRKWQDMKALLHFGEEYYAPYEQQMEPYEQQITVKHGQKESCQVAAEAESGHTILKKEQDVIRRIIYLERSLEAPVASNQIVGGIRYEINGEPWFEIPVYTREEIDKITIADNLYDILQRWAL